MSLLKDMKGKAYWRSLDELDGTPEFQEFLHREFPQGASELNDPLSRRTFLRLMGASAALAGLAGCRRPVEKIVPYVKAPEDVIPGIPQYFATAMPTPSGAFGLIVESHEGRPTKIEGNPAHPSTSGRSNSHVQAEILNFYDPDRASMITRAGEPAAWSDFVTFWAELYPGFVNSRGKGLAVLARPFSSPSLARLQREFEDTFPEATWVSYDPISDENIDRGIRAANGRAYQAVYRYGNADVVLSLDADFLLNESENIANTRGFATRRRVTSERDSMNRLYVVEPTYTITGGMADHRLPLQGGEIGAFALALAQELGRQGVAVAGTSGLQGAASGSFDRKWLQEVAKDLVGARGRSIVTAGKRQPAAVHALVFAINAALQNNGKTVEYFPLQDKTRSDVDALAALKGQIDAGGVDTLCIIGGNPAYDAPADLGFGDALAKVAHVVQLDKSLNETSGRAEWQIPGTHFLEAWGDVRAADGTMSVVQPLIAPLFDGKSDLEFLHLVCTGREKSGHDIVRETWRLPGGLANGEKKWRRILHDGVLENSALVAVVPGVDGASLNSLLRSELGSATRATADQLELSFIASPSLGDGSYANNGWLQELPDPVTKLTWDNVAMVSVKFASERGLRNGELVQLELDGRTLQMPAWILPGQADYTVSVELGYGRSRAGRVGDGVGFDTYTLRTRAKRDYAAGLKLTGTGREYELATTQDHGSMEGREIVRMATLAAYREEPDFASEPDSYPHLDPIKDPDGEYTALWDEHRYDTGYQWGMSIDLNSCTGCNACTIACQSENNIPIVGKDQVRRGREMHWLRLDRYFEGDDLNNPAMVYQPVGCQHCEMAPCEQVCPVAATVHDAEGLNVMTYNRCIGTRYCSNNCPFKVRRFNFYNLTSETPEIVKMAMNPNVTVRFRGVMEKCTYCVQRINEAKIAAKLEERQVRDGDVTSACEQTCPSEAIVFGNINDPESRVSKVKKQNRDYEMLSELNLRTRTTYLAKLRNPNPALETSAPADA